MHPRDFQLPAAAFSGPRDLQIRWLGTAGFELVAPDAVLYIDPYLTRASLGRFLFRKLVPATDRIAALAAGAAEARARAILVSHSHFDHALDVPTLAKLTGAHVYGSRSTANLMQAHGSTAATALEHGRKTTFECGPFRVTAVPSAHSTFALGGRVPYAGDIPCTCDIAGGGLKGSAYRCGDVFNFLIEYGDFRMYHLGSANLAEDQIPSEARGIDLLLLCIIARFATEKFIPRTVAALAPGAVVPMHYDNMFRRADKPMMLLPRTDFGRFVDDLRAVSDEPTIVTLPLTSFASAPLATSLQGSPTP